MVNIVVGSPVPSTIQTPSTPAVQTLRLTEGQMVKATVRQVTETALLLEVNGRTLAAHSDIPFQVGQQVSLAVASLDPARIVLQLVDQTGMPPVSQSGNPMGSLEAMLARWGIEANQVNVAIAQSLFTQTLEVDSEAVRFIGRQLSLLSADVQGSGSSNGPAAPTGALTQGQLANVAALVHLYANEIPICPESVELAHHQLTSSQLTGSQIGRLQVAMETVLMRLGEMPTGTVGLDGLRNALQAATEHVSDWTVRADLPADQTGPKLEVTIPRLATPSEAVLAASASSTDTPQVQVVVAKANPALPAEPVMVSLEEPTGMELLRSSPQKILHDLQKAVQEVLKQEMPDSPATHAMRRLNDDLRTLAKDLAVTHLNNAGSNSSGLAEPSFLFPIPLTTPDGNQTAYLKVYKDADGQVIDPNNTRLALLFDLPQLGEIAVSLSILDKQVNGQVLCGTQATHDLVTRELGELRGGLSHLGYSIGSLSSNLLASAGPKETSVPDGSPGTGLSLANIDLTA